jgi:hypothetical protein
MPLARVLVPASSESDLRTAAHRLNSYFEKERGTLTGTLAELLPNTPTEKTSDLVGIMGGILEPASGIEPPTCGLRNLHNPISDNPSPQETTKQDAFEVGPDGACLSCAGSSVVADENYSP